MQDASSVFDALDTHIAVLDENGALVSSNSAWNRLDLTGEPGFATVGDSFLQACETGGDEAGQLIADGARSVLRGVSRRFEITQSVISATCQRWFHLVITPHSNGMPGAVVARTEVTPFMLQRLAESAREDDAAKLKQARARIEFLDRYDPLTSLPNHHSALERLSARLDSSHKPQSSLGLISMELAGFREFNDTYGYSMGDRLLKEAAASLMSFGNADFELFRLSGPVFLFLFPGVHTHTDLNQAYSFLLDISIAKVVIEGIELYLQFHAGASLAPHDGSDPEKLLRQVSMARKQAKHNGLQRLQFYEPRMSDELARFVQTSQALQLALERRELQLYYQPQIDLASGRIVGAEALMRWNRPGHGLVAPSYFIGAAEDSGLIRPMGRWALREACHQAMNWQAAGFELRMAVNLSAVQFRHEGIRWDVIDALDESGLSPHSLELELTESMLLDDGDELPSTLAFWKTLGIQIAIDDFGTGYSSLSYLKRLAVDKLKIDRSFVSDFQHNQQDRSIVQAVLQMARSLHMRTVAEGIEDDVVAKQLAALGCDEGQGYLYAQPMPADEFMDWLQQQEFRHRAGSA